MPNYNDYDYDDYYQNQNGYRNNGYYWGFGPRGGRNGGYFRGGRNFRGGPPRGRGGRNPNGPRLNKAPSQESIESAKSNGSTGSGFSFSSDKLKTSKKKQAMTDLKRESVGQFCIPVLNTNYQVACFILHNPTVQPVTFNGNYYVLEDDKELTSVFKYQATYTDYIYNRIKKADVKKEKYVKKYKDDKDRQDILKSLTAEDKGRGLADWITVIQGIVNKITTYVNNKKKET